MEDNIQTIFEGLGELQELINANKVPMHGSQLKLLVNTDTPCLSWILTRSSSGITVETGDKVEHFKNGFFEGVWSGDFDEPASLLTTEAFGSGVLFLDNGVNFITRSDTREFLFILKDLTLQTEYISNSVCYVLERSNISTNSVFWQSIEANLVDRTFEELKKGFHRAATLVATDGRYELHRICYANFLIKNDGEFVYSDHLEIDVFDDFAHYQEFLLKQVHCIFQNGSHPSRAHRLTPISSISRGYDSCAVSALAAKCGCEEYITLDVKEDNGASVAAQMGVECKVVPHIYGFFRRYGIVRNLPFWLRKKAFEFVATAGIGDDISMLPFEPYLSSKIFLSGVGGDDAWNRFANVNLGLARSIPNTTSLTEYRLRVGFAHFAPILCGSISTESLIKISNSEEMKSYSVNNDYDRPIPRRIVENIGVERGSFAQKKGAQNPYIKNHRKLFHKSVEHIRYRYRQAAV